MANKANQESEPKSIFPDWMISVASALASFISEKFGNPNKVYQEGTMTSIEDSPTTIPGSDWE